MPDDLFEQSNDRLLAVEEPDGSVNVYERVTPQEAEAYESLGVERNEAASWGAFGMLPLRDVIGDGGISMQASADPDGTAFVSRRRGKADRYLSPRITVPGDYYTRVRWANEYYEQEPLVNSLVNRDVDQAIKPLEFQLPEDQENAQAAKDALEKWRRTLNRSIGQHNGLDEYAKQTALRIIKSSLIVSIANWGTMQVKGKTVKVPRVLQNLDPELLIPYLDPISGERIYYYKISEQQKKDLLKTRRADNAWRQILGDLRGAIVDELPKRLIDIVANQRLNDYIDYDSKFYTGPFIRIPPELVYVINYRSDADARYPVPTLVPIFSAIAMKRKLHLADWAVADGMINMLLVWTFPPGTDPDTAKGIVRTAASGGRVQSISLPGLVKVEIITPPTDLLNSADKFWIPISEILAHFGFPLNSRSRGAGDLDSAGLDTASNKGRLDTLREAVEGLINFWLEQIAERNGWEDLDPTALLPRLDLDQSDAFRAFVLSMYDRGLFSAETAIALGGSTIARELARRKAEKADGTEDVLAIRPSFSQTVGVPGDGRTPNSQAKPGAGDTQQKPRGGANPNRPQPSSQSQTSQS